MSIWQDLRLAARGLVRTPGFSATALLTLLVCIGATTAVFGVVNQVLLQPLPLPEPDRLVTFRHRAPSKGLAEVDLNDALFAFYRRNRQLLADVAAHEVGRFVLTGTGDPEVLTGARVSFNYFDVLGRQPQYGRTFLPEEETRDRGAVAILSYGLWQRRFGGVPSVVGHTIKLDNRPVVVVGIMPAGFDFPDRSERADADEVVQLWLPKPIDSQDLNSWNLAPVARLKPGVTLEDGQREIDALWKRFLEEFGPRLADGGLGSDTSTVMTTLHRRIVRDLRTALLVLLAGSGHRPSDCVRQPRQPVSHSRGVAATGAGRPAKSRRHHSATRQTGPC